MGELLEKALCILWHSQAIFASAHRFAISIWLHPLSSLPTAPHRPRRAPPCVPPASPCLPPAPPCLSLAEARTPATSRHGRCATPCAPPRPQQTSKLQQLGVRFELQQHKISVEQLDSWIQEVDSDNCSLILTICSCIGRINSARNPDLRQEDIGPVICSDKSSITHQISQFVLRGSLICSTSWSFTRGESSMQQQQRRHGTFAPSRRPFMRGLDVAAVGRAPSLGVEVELGEDMIGAVACRLHSFSPHRPA